MLRADEVRDEGRVEEDDDVALQGTIETFALPDVLRLLASSKKTGRLRVSGTRGSGSVWVESGQIVQSDASAAPHALSNVDVVFELLRFRDGSFTFENDRHAPDPNGQQEVEPVLIEAELQLAEWHEIEAVIPSIDCGVQLVPDLPRADVVIDAEKWRVLVAIGGGTSVSQVGDKLILGEMPVSRAIRELVELGVVEIVPPGTLAEPTAAPEPPRRRRSTPEPVLDVVDAEPVLDVVDPEPFGEPEDEPEVAPEPERLGRPERGEPVAFDHGDDHDDEDLDEPVGRTARAELDALTEGFGFDDAPPDHVSSTQPKAAYDFGSDGPPPGEYDALGPAPFGSDEPMFQDSGGDPLFADPPSFGGDPLFADPTRPAPPPPPPPPGANGNGNGDAGEVARQLANLSPKAARAVAAAARAGSEEEREAYLSEAEDDGGVNRSLLLKFLSAPQD
jgi:hypothetical protein